MILILSNPEVVQAAADAVSQLKASEADLKSFKVQLESSLLAAESTAAAAKADYEQAKLRAQVNEDFSRRDWFRSSRCGCRKSRPSKPRHVTRSSKSAMRSPGTASLHNSP